MKAVKNRLGLWAGSLVASAALLVGGQSEAATSGTINLTGTVNVVLDLTVDQAGYTTAFTNSQLVSGMSGSYQDVAKLLVSSNNYYTITLDDLHFSTSEPGGSNIALTPKLAPKGGSAQSGTPSGTSVVFTINDQNDGTGGNGDVVSVTTGGDSNAVGGNYTATISVTLAAQ